MQIGYKLSTEGFGPTEIVRQAVAAERAGFDFVEMSDHFHPWLSSQQHSANTWVLMGMIAAKTSTIGLVTGVTCPSFRYHPAIVAQMAATLQIVSENRFTLGVGSGERLNEHITGQEFPSVSKRHERLTEALQIIRLLWEGGYQSFEGTHLQLDDARVFDLPDRLPEICVAVSGPASVRLAQELGDGIFAVEPDPELVPGFRSSGKAGPAFAEVPLSYAGDEKSAIDSALETGRFALTGWKVMSELPNPVNFDAATQTVRPEDVREAFACGPDVSKHLQAAQPYVDAGFDHLVMQNVGPDPDAFLRFFADELRDGLHSLAR